MADPAGSPATADDDLQMHERRRPVAGAIVLAGGILLVVLAVITFIKASWDGGLVLLAFAAVWIACGIGMRRFPAAEDPARGAAHA